MKKLLCAICVFICVAITSNAQEVGGYQRGIGLRAGAGYYDIVSASFKAFVTVPGAIELNLGFRPSYSVYGQSHLSFSASYQHHFPIGSIEGLKWFIGGGAIAYNTFSKYNDYKGFGVGLFPTGGVDYKFGNIPLNVSADVRPTIGIVRPSSYYNSFYAGNVGLSARYTF